MGDLWGQPDLFGLCFLTCVSWLILLSLQCINSHIQFKQSSEEPVPIEFLVQMKSMDQKYWGEFEVPSGCL